MGLQRRVLCALGASMNLAAATSMLKPTRCSQSLKITNGELPSEWCKARNRQGGPLAVQVAGSRCHTLILVLFINAVKAQSCKSSGVLNLKGAPVVALGVH
jgi:hypothetical protein